MNSSTRPASEFATEELQNDLLLFDRATNWKSYWASFVKPFVRGRVLEVGAGNGGSITYLLGQVTDWLCLEPDAALAERLREAIGSGALPSYCRLQMATLNDMPQDELFDTILYMDVIEHLAEDEREAALAAKHLAPGGALVILAPAHQFLFSPFDKAIGHYRRYDRRSLAHIIPGSLEETKLIYLDSAGMLLSLGNRLLLRSSRPGAGSLRFWNDVVVPISRRLDALLGYNVGKTVLGVWRKADGAKFR